MAPSLFDIILLALSFTGSTAALGINCRGSANCNTFGNSQIAVSLTHAIDGIDPNRWYNNGEHIACVGTGAPITGNGGFCAFLQNTGGTNGAWIKSIAHNIPEHGCKTCGSVPYYFPGDNDVSKGELTYNYVDDSCSQDGATLC
ncbi:killer toxin [Penicillium bovifimosum]|uniref:Killer toxin n=1 Tax=Penicillium bovifimosum TaxID=126998 RepID=A0A9W9HAD4_9EURO|nr:killer toxin [Penicillium bovifimosum]KAJ5142873.1 killer toxin [Penicillium bovifimosum]